MQWPSPKHNRMFGFNGQNEGRQTDKRGPGEMVEKDREKNLLRGKVCCNPDAILWQFPYSFVVDVFWYEFFRRAGEQLWYEWYSRQDDNFSNRQQIKEGLTLQSIKFRGWRGGWLPRLYYAVCGACFWRVWVHNVVSVHQHSSCMLCTMLCFVCVSK